MDLAWISLFALLATLLISCTTAVNPGLLAIVFAWLIGVYVAPALGHSIDLKMVLAGFPAELFLTLAGVTLLFAQAQVNGTLDRLAGASVRACRGNVGLMPLMFFTLTLAIASIGAGNIAASALVAPTAMAVAGRAGIPAFLMTIMVAHGAIAGALSPFAPTGIIVEGLMVKIGLPGHHWQAYASNLLANALVAVAGYLVFGGWRLFRRSFVEDGQQQAPVPYLDDVQFPAAVRAPDPIPATAQGPLLPRHGTTLALIAVLIVGVVGFKVQVGMGAFAVALVLILARMADEKEAIRAMPWGVILMVCGVTVLTNLLDRTGGIDLFTSFQARASTRYTVNGVTAFFTGLISVYSSTSSVVLPVFLPTVPKLIARLGGGDPLSVASSMMIGGHLVDSSPLSTIGAICVASAAPHENRRRLFNQTLIWGLSMAVVGALICQFGFKAR